MSSNLAAAWPYGIFCVSDRRLVDLASGRIRTNRSTKMTVFGCADAHGVIMYNGIGMDDEGRTPNEWLLRLQENEKVFDRSLPEVLASVRIDLERRLQPIRERYGPTKARHTFAFAVWHCGVSVLYNISNYEWIDNRDEAPEGNEQVLHSSAWPTKDSKLRILSTGVHTRRSNLEAIARAIKTGPPRRIRALCVKALKDVAYGRGRARGTVGATCQWAFVGPKRDDVWCGMDVVGGANAQETPNLINISANMSLGGTQSVRMGGPGMIVADSYAGDQRAANIGHYDSSTRRFAFSEPPCGFCGNPLPAAHQYCEICLYDEQI